MCQWLVWFMAATQFPKPKCSTFDIGIPISVASQIDLSSRSLWVCFCLPRKRRKKGNLLVNHEVHGKWRSPVDFHEILSRREANRSSRIWKPVSNQSHKTIAHKPRLWDGLSHVQHKLCFVVLTSLTDMHLCYNPRIRTASCLPLSPPAANPTKRSLSSRVRVRVGSTWGSTKTSKRQGSRKKCSQMSFIEYRFTPTSLEKNAC